VIIGLIETLFLFVVLVQNQLYIVVKKYVEYYNTKRPHQGIEQRVPKGGIL